MENIKIKQGSLKTQGNLVLLAHDAHFRQSRKNEKGNVVSHHTKLEEYIKKLRGCSYDVSFHTAKDYPLKGGH